LPVILRYILRSCSTIKQTSSDVKCQRQIRFAWQPQARDVQARTWPHDAAIKTKPISTSSFKLIYLVFTDALRHSPVVKRRNLLLQLRQYLSVSFLGVARRPTIDSLVFQRRSSPGRLMQPADSVDDEWDAECQGLRMGGHVHAVLILTVPPSISVTLVLPM